MEDPKWACSEQIHGMWYVFTSMLWHCWLGDRKVIRPVKSWVLVCRWWRMDWSFARLIAPVVTVTSNILAPIKSQNGRHSSTGLPGWRHYGLMAVVWLSVCLSVLCLTLSREWKGIASKNWQEESPWHCWPVTPFRVWKIKQLPGR